MNNVLLTYSLIDFNFICLYKEHNLPDGERFQWLILTSDVSYEDKKKGLQGAKKNIQSRDTGNIGYTRHRTKTNKLNKG
jgi:hypothetical protein